MTEEQTPESGAANTPPFPRADRPVEPEAAPEAGAPDEPAAEPPTHSDSDADRPLPPPHSSRAREEAGPGRRRAAAGGVLGRAGDQLVHRAERMLYRGLGHLADQCDEAVRRIEGVTGDRLHALGPQAERAAGAAASAADWLSNTADYLRNADLPVLQRDLERQVREKPLQSLLVAAGAGWLFGKIVR